MKNICRKVKGGMVEPINEQLDTRIGHDVWWDVYKQTWEVNRDRVVQSCLTHVCVEIYQRERGIDG